LPRLDWIPNKLKPPRHLFDTQRDWWRNIVDAMFENDLMQGHLPKTADLCLLAGARTRAFWNANCAAVLACFESVKVGSQEVICYRPLLDLIATQRSKLRGPKHAREGPLSSPSQSGFDFDSKKEKEGKLRPKTVRENPYQQADFDARDLRLMKKAADEFHRRYDANTASAGTQQPEWIYNPREVFEWICQQAGITVARGLELEVLRKKWPESEGSSDGRRKTKAAGN